MVDLRVAAVVNELGETIGIVTLGEAIGDLRSAGERLQGKRERSSGRAGTVLVAGLALAILFNPVTGPETRRFIRELLAARDDGAHAHDGERGESERRVLPGSGS